jgi:hypothetical protein
MKENAQRILGTCCTTAQCRAARANSLKVKHFLEIRWKTKLKNIFKECLDLDKNDYCSYWSSIGECEANPYFMLLECRWSCSFCPSQIPQEATGNFTLLHKIAALDVF